MQGTDRIRRFAALAAVTIVAVALAACGPTTPPAPQLSWQSTTAGIDPGGDETILTATSATWWANVRTVGATDGPATLELHARGGPHGVPAAAPTQTIPLGQFAGAMAMSEHLLVVRVRDAANTVDEMRLFELDPATSTWSAAATVPVPVLADASVQLDLSDDTLVVGRPFTFGGGPDGDVHVVPLDRSGPGVSWSPATVQVFTPDPTWSLDERAKYGHDVAVDGDTLAFGAGERVVVLRRGATWAPDTVLTDAAGPLTGFARSLDVDTSTGSPRVLVGVQGRFDLGVPRPGQAQLFQRGVGGGWTLVHTYAADPAGALGGFGFGAQVALDGSLAVFGMRWMQPATTAGGVVDDYQIEVRELRSSTETIVSRSLLDLVGGVDAGWGTVGPFSLDVAGGHVAVSGFAQPPGGASRFFTVSYDRRPQ